MKYLKEKNKLIISDANDFNIIHILECGQVFSYQKIGEAYYVFPKNKLCKVFVQDEKYIIETDDVLFFENYFDLKTDYSNIKKQLNSFDELSYSVDFGYGMRILKQDLLETIISFIISSNNNIKRIKNTLFEIRKHFNHKIDNEFGVLIYAFPSLEELKTLDEDFFKRVGAGYRAKYLVKTIDMLDEFLKKYGLENSKKLPTKLLEERLMELCGVGRKVAECVLLFGYGRHDVFPVDTWIKKVYKDVFDANVFDASKICDFLIDRYKNLSGYAQQYLFYSKRGNKF